MSDIWSPVEAALDRAAAVGRMVDLWLRDDDAITTTAALDRLTRMAQDAALPVLLAVIPGAADRRLADHVMSEPLLTPTQHGFMHLNHAAAGERACEIGGKRPLEVTLAELARGRDRMNMLFGGTQTDILVPPWNRIAPAVLPHLPDLGFAVLSTFGALHVADANVDVVNCNLDIIDWRNGRVCHREDKLVNRLADLIDAGRPIGLLTHHLVHDEAAWTFLSHALARLAARPNVRFTSPDGLRAKHAHA